MLGEFGGALEAPLSERPNVDEMLVNDDLDPVERFKLLAFSTYPLQRICQARSLVDAARDIGYTRTVSHILPLIESILNDTETSVRQAIMEKLKTLADFLFEQNPQEAYTHVLNVLLPICADKLTDEHPEVRVGAGESLVHISSLLRSEDRGTHVLTMVLRLAHDDEHEEFRVKAIELLSELADQLGRDLCQQFVALEMISLGEDPSFRVRKATAQHFPKVCQVVGPDFTTKRMLPVFLRMSEDAIWGVRKAIAEAVAGVSAAVSSELRGGALRDMVERMAKDNSKWVQIALFQQLGPYIATLSPDQVSPALLQYYLSMATIKVFATEEISYFCAYSFPAVLLTLGKDRWADLCPTFLELVKDMQWKVRRTLAFSLHELAKIIGTDLAERDLLPVFDLFLKDLEEVKTGAVQNYSKFLEILSPSKREIYLSVLQEIQSDPENWRLRTYLAKQIKSFSQIFSPASVYSVIVPLAMKLCTDQVAEVRLMAYEGIPALIMRLGEAEREWQALVIAQITALATSATFKDRQIFIMMCESLVVDLPWALFQAKFLDHLIALHSDHVPNVRLVWSRIVSRILPHSRLLYDNPLLKAALEKAQKDKDRDVRYYAQGRSEAALRTPPRSRAETADSQGSYRDTLLNTPSTLDATVDDTRVGITDLLVNDIGDVSEIVVSSGDKQSSSSSSAVSSSSSSSSHSDSSSPSVSPNSSPVKSTTASKRVIDKRDSILLISERIGDASLANLASNPSPFTPSPS
eukprot:GILI01003566.1.p1 GENE.GILI01003566.1~~GILI01003566.1.p1  ORF type:complete len:751 (-),score=141.61 GILI01003566.1:76-2328(-)